MYVCVHANMYGACEDMVPSTFPLPLNFLLFPCGPVATCPISNILHTQSPTHTHTSQYPQTNGQTSICTHLPYKQTPNWCPPGSPAECPGTHPSVPSRARSVGPCASSSPPSSSVDLPHPPHSPRKEQQPPWGAHRPSAACPRHCPHRCFLQIAVGSVCVVYVCVCM